MESYPAKQVEKRKFSKSDEGKYFSHSHKTLVGENANCEHMGMVRQFDVGYCQMAQFGQKGISLPLLTAWSGCLTPGGELEDGDLAALVEVRKIADVVATENITPKTKRI